VVGMKKQLMMVCTAGLGTVRCRYTGAVTTLCVTVTNCDISLLRASESNHAGSRAEWTLLNIGSNA
jgi:hypothetical protein